MLRIALIGTGKNVVMGHAPALLSLRDRYTVTAIADQSPQALEEIGVLLSVPPASRYADYRVMLNEEKLDIVDIAVPHLYHHECIMAALQAGAHVISEPPLALSFRDAEESLMLAERHGRLITALHYFLAFPPVREAVRLVRDGEIGEPFLVRCEGLTGGYGPGTESYHPQWHGNPEIAGGGVWMNSGYHGAYLCEALMHSAVTAVSANIEAFVPGLDVDDTALALFKHHNGGASSLLTAWSAPSGGRQVLEVHGSEGSIIFGHDAQPLGIFSNDTRIWQHPEIPIPPAESFTGIFRQVAECLIQGAAPPVTHREALHTLQLVLTAYRASDEDKVLLLEE